MKIVDHSNVPQTITYLPEEVLILIVDRIRQSQSPSAAQKTLWACCLVSRSWYASTVKPLYSMPVLSSRNFPEFARTISPPLSSHARRVGLEDFVQVLDMGMLAYESKKSTTSRLISRTKGTLRTFVAPAVSFSTTSLAPLSKCRSLQILDLSRDVYDFDLAQLMRSIKSISTLTWLNLPKDCLTFHHETNYSLMALQKSSFWPTNLHYLQLNESHMQTSEHLWGIFLTCLPPELSTLSFRNCATYDPFDSMARVEVKVPQVTTLSMHVHRSDDTYYFNHLMQPFPNVRNVTMPAMTSWLLKNFLFMSTDSSWSLSTSVDSMPKPPQNMETLILEESADWPTASHITIPHLRQFVEQCPGLLHIDVPEAYLYLDDEDEDGLDRLNEKLNERAQHGRENLVSEVAVKDVGIFATERAPNTGVGLKRSFRYRGGD